jgi:hypothetical protein
LDGFAFIMTENGRVYNSDLNSITAWTAIGYIPTNSNPDEGSGGVWRRGDKLLAFSQGSIEVLRNTGNAAGSPLSYVETINIGAFSANSICELDGDLYWVSSFPKSGGLGIYALTGQGADKISNDEMENIITSYAPSSLFLSGASIGGKRVLFVTQLTAPTANYVIDVTNGLVCESTQKITRTSGIFESNSASGDVYCGANDTNGVIRFKTADPSYSLTLTAQLGRQDFGNGNRKFLKSIELVADQQSSGTTTLQISTDDFATFTTLGTFDMTAAKKIIHRCGSFKGGASFKLTHSANTPWRGEALIVEYEVGSH